MRVQIQTDRTPVAPAARENPYQAGNVGKKSSFARALKEAQTRGEVTFSKHALERLSAWGEPLGEERMDGLRRAFDAASTKGARSTLVLLKGVAFVVAPQERTVVTVIPEGRMKESIFTSIDSAVLMDR